MIGYNTKTFKEVFDSADTFTNALADSAFKGCVNNSALIYALLYSKFANSHIVGKDEDQWKMRLLARLYSVGPTYEKKIDIQKKLRELSEDDLVTNSKMISKMGYNPSTTSDFGPNPLEEEISTVDQQNTSKSVSGKLNAYSNLWLALRTDITSSFLNEFKDLFISVILPGTINEAIIPIPEKDIEAIYSAIESVSTALDDKVDKEDINNTNDATELAIETYNEEN